MDAILEQLPSFVDEIKSIKETIITNIVLIGQIPSPTFQEKRRTQFFMERLFVRCERKMTKLIELCKKCIRSNLYNNMYNRNYHKKSEICSEYGFTMEYVKNADVQGCVMQKIKINKEENKK